MPLPDAITRRRLVTLTAMTPLVHSLVDPANRPGERAPATFVLVHGAWHGGWCWQKLVPLLRADGHHVHTPTLTGLGERAHLLKAEIGLGTHVEDVVALIEYEALQQVILVGHSYGGMVITGVADRVPSRIAQLVYLDAFVPEGGKALRDYAPVPPTRDDGWRIPPPGTPASWGVTDPADAAWVQQRLGDQPIKTFTDPLRAPLTGIPASRQSYVQCTSAPFFEEAAQRAMRNGMKRLELHDAGHDAMITRPASLASILTGLA